MSRRPFERPATISLPGSDEALEGLYVPVENVSMDPGDPVGEGTGAVIAPPHPQYGGSMESPVVTELAHACARAGVSSLRFNWRGVGASAGAATGDEAVAAADYTAAVDWLEATVPGRVAACGYSFGAATAAHAGLARARVTRLVLVAPPPSMLSRETLAQFDGDVLVAVGDRDEFAPFDAVEAMCKGLPRLSLEKIEDADHFFMAHLAEVEKLARRFLAR